jgi:hypothetical protein
MERSGALGMQKKRPSSEGAADDSRMVLIPAGFVSDAGSEEFSKKIDKLSSPCAILYVSLY